MHGGPHPGEVVLIEAVGDQCDRSLRAGREIVAHIRSHGNHRIRPVEHLPFELMMPAVGPSPEFQMLVVEHLGPRIAEISYPFETERFLESEADEVHGLGRPGGDDSIDRMLL